VINLKKSVSPLIATIVLISFTIAIGSLVINWGKQFITAQTQALEQAGVECTKENAQIIKAVAKVFTQGKNVYTNVTLSIRNTGSVPLEAEVVNIYTESGQVYTNQSLGFTGNNKLEPGVAKSASVVFKFNASKDKPSFLEIPSKNCPNNIYYYSAIEVK